jgi:transcriptional regulator with GAF, ATPase, and Fis domain
VLARLVHTKSGRSERKYVVVNCSSLRGELLESELFGHKKGSFTGAVSDHNGLFSEADGGTLFLDEIGEMDVMLQAKLLRTLETGKIRPVGSSAEESVDVRIICATNQDLESMVEKGAFRKDLHYRLNHFVIKLPPLKEREDDILLLAYFFLDMFKARYPNKELADFHPDSLKAIAFYEWPGNVRELSSVIHRAVLSCEGPLVTLDLPSQQHNTIDFDKATRDFQKTLVNRALHIAGGNREKAASLLGISRSTFFRYLAASDN